MGETERRETEKRNPEGRRLRHGARQNPREGPTRTSARAPLTILPVRPPPSGPYAPGLRSPHTQKGLGQFLRAAQSRRLPARGGGRRMGVRGGALKATRRRALREETWARAEEGPHWTVNAGPRR